VDDITLCYCSLHVTGALFLGIIFSEQILTFTKWIWHHTRNTVSHLSYCISV